MTTAYVKGAASVLVTEHPYSGADDGDTSCYRRLSIAHESIL